METGGPGPEARGERRRGGALLGGEDEEDCSITYNSSSSSSHNQNCWSSLAALLDEEGDREPRVWLPAFRAGATSPTADAPKQTLSPVPSREPVMVEIRQDSKDCLGGRVWRASSVLLRFLEARYLEGIGGMRILELGSGTGVLGIALAKAQPPPAKVVMTDYQEALVSLIQDNIHRNGVGEVCEVMALDWRQAVHDDDDEGGATRLLREALLAAASGEEGGGGFDLVLAADCVYYQHLYAGLIATMHLAATTTHDARGGGGCEVVIANDDSRTDAQGYLDARGERWDQGFFRMLGQRFAWQDDMPPLFHDDSSRGGGGPYRIVTATPLPNNNQQQH